MAAVIQLNDHKRLSRSSAASVFPTLTRDVVIVMVMIMIVFSYAPLTGVKAQSVPSLSLSVMTPTSTDSRFSTWISPLASSLLSPSTHGVFWGAVAAQDVQNMCQLVESGWQTMVATIDAYSSTTTQTIQLLAIGGCDASSYSPIGVEVVYTDDSGRSSALICDNNAWSIGCAIYVTGDDVENIVNTVQNYGQVANVDDTFMANYTNKNRKPLQVADGGCRAVAIATGGAIGGYAAATVCPAFGVFAVLCVPATVFIGSFVIGMTGASICQVMGHAQCFPGEASVVVPNGETKPMFALSIGDEVAVRASDGSVKFESIYAFGHSDGNNVGTFIELELTSLSTNSMPSRKIIHISPLHFSVIIEGGKLDYRRSKDVNVGDIMLIINGDNILHQAQVYRKSIVLMQGLYNPLTIGGTIIVDGVVVSTHSEWFLDATLDSINLTNWIPPIYQMLLFPVRVLYATLGKDKYIPAYKYIERNWNIHDIGYHHGQHTIAILISIIPIFFIIHFLPLKKLLY